MLACAAVAGPTQVPVCKTDQTLPGDLESGDNYGASVAAETYAVVGAPNQDRFVSGVELQDAGAAYVLTLDLTSGDWIIDAKLLAHPDNPNLVQQGEHFGDAVDTDGEVIIVGAWGRDVGLASDAGAAYIFRRNDATDGWEQEQILTASDGETDDHFGGYTDESFTELNDAYASRPQSVAVDGGLAVIGAADDDSVLGNLGFTDGGSVYVFRYDTALSPPQWVQDDQLLPPSPQVSSHFGWSVDIDRSVGRLVVGEPLARLSGQDPAGRAHVFVRSGGQWNHEQTLEFDTPMTNDAFGWSVSIDGDNILIGAPADGVNGEVGFAALFTRTAGGWTQEQTSVPSAPDDEANSRFGYSTVLAGGAALIGAIRRDVPNVDSNVGAAFAFRRSTGQWVEWFKLLPNDTLADADDRFGVSVALTGDNAFAGARTDEPANRPPDDDRGAAYVYTNIPDCN